MPNRTDLLNHLIKKHGLKTYLEIGVQDPKQNFDKIESDCKVGVDPSPMYSEENVIHLMTSDDFFNNFPDGWPNNELKIKFDLIFIDGLHSAEQVKKDFENSLRVLSPNGFIVLHDCNPEDEAFTHFPRDKKGSWNGDVYKFAAALSISYKFTVDIDHGVTCVQPISKPTVAKHPTWDYFDKNRKELLNLISWDEFINL